MGQEDDFSYRPIAYATSKSRDKNVYDTLTHLNRVIIYARRIFSRFVLENKTRTSHVKSDTNSKGVRFINICPICYHPICGSV